MAQNNPIYLHEAIILALIKEPLRTANFEQIATFISKRNLFPNRKGNISLAKQVMLRSTKSKGAYNKYFEDLGAGYIHLKDCNAFFPIQLMNALEALLSFDNRFYNPVAKELSVVSIGIESKETHKIKLSPDRIICILSKEKSRRKQLYVLEKRNDNTENIVSYYFNNNELNFETLCSYLDPISGHLVRVSKSAIVNVAYFNLVNKQKLSLVYKEFKSVIPSTIPVSGKNEKSHFLQNFTVVKEAYNRRILLQKTALGYKSESGL